MIFLALFSASWGGFSVFLWESTQKVSLMPKLIERVLQRNVHDDTDIICNNFEPPMYYRNILRPTDRAWCMELLLIGDIPATDILLQCQSN